MNTFGVLRKTYLFVLLRFVIICVTIAPIVWVVRYYVTFLIDLFGLSGTVGMVRTVFVGCFAYIGFLVGWFVFGVIRRTLLFYIKSAHVIAITKLCVDDAPVVEETDDKGNVINERILVGMLVLDSFKEVFKRFISVNIFYIADGLVLKGISDVSNLVLTQNVIPILKNQNILTKFLGRTIKTTLSYSDEIVLSYTFFRCRLFELYGKDDETVKRGRKKGESTKTKETVKDMLGYIVDGMCLYVKSCLPLMKSAFITILTVDIFGMITSVLIIIVLFFTFNVGILNVLVIFVVLRIIYEVLSYTFLEPYETAALVSEFYEIISDEEEDVSTDDVRDKLASLSKPFKSLVEKAFGRDETKAVAAGSLIEGDLLDIAKKGLSKAASDEDEVDSVD